MPSKGDINPKKQTCDTLSGGEGGMNWESDIEHTLQYVKQMASGNLMYDLR